MRQDELKNKGVFSIFIKYVIPSILVMLSQNIAILVDSFFIGNYIGSNGLSAIALFFPLVSLFIGICLMISVGSNNLSGISLGKNNYIESNKLFNIGFWSIITISIILTLFVQIFLGNLIGLLNTSGEVKIFVEQYAKVISIFLIFFMLNIVLSLFIKLEGKPQLIIVSTLIGTVINIFLDYVFIVKLSMGLIGAGLATGLSQVVIFIFLIFYYLKYSDWKISRFRIEFSLLKKICKNGFSQFIMNTANSFSGFILNILVLKYLDVTWMAGFAITKQILNIVASIGNGVGEASRVAISYNYGSNLFSRVKSFRKLTLLVNVISGVLIALVSYIYSDTIVGIFVTDEKVIEVASIILKYQAYGFVFVGANISIGIYFAAINESILSSMFTLYRCLISILMGLFIFMIMIGNMGIFVTLIFKQWSTFVVGIILIKIIDIKIKKNSFLN